VRNMEEIYKTLEMKLGMSNSSSLKIGRESVDDVYNFAPLDRTKYTI
jgi:hypothetical protein